MTDPNVPTRLPDPAVEVLDERFLPLMERMGLQDYWSKRGIKPDFMSA